MIRLKQIILLGCLFILSSSVLNAQKAKFKNKLTSVQKVRLPLNYVAPENRTYNLYTKGKYADEVETYERGIYGWKLDKENPSMKGVISIYGFTLGSPKKSSQAKTKKDKDGNITDKWTEYTYTASAVGKSTLYIYGSDSEYFKYKRKDAKKSKYEEKEEEKKESLSTNKFLSEEDISDAEESDIGDDSGLDSENLPLSKTFSLNQDKKVTSDAKRSSSDAYKDFIANEGDKLIDFKHNFPSLAYDDAIATLNMQYGYTPVIKRFYLNTMKSDKHEEFDIWNDACAAIETLFKSFKYNKSIDSYQEKFNPILEYFDGIVNSISDGDRKEKKLRIAAYENLIKTMYYLDRHDAVIDMCTKNLSSKMLDRASKRMLDDAQKQLAHLEFHSMTTCHMEALEEVSEDSFEVSEEEAPEEDGEE